MTVITEDVAFPDVDAASFESLDPPLSAVPDPPETLEEPPRRRRGRPPGRTKPTTGNPPGRPPRAAGEKALAEALADPMTKLAAAVSFALPTTGAVIGHRAAVTSTALVRYAADKPRMLAALKRVSNVGPASELVETLAMVIIAAQLDIGKLDPNHPLPTLTGVSRIHTDIRGHIADVQREQQMAETIASFGAPPPGWDPMNFSDPANPMFSFQAGSGAAMRN